MSPVQTSCLKSLCGLSRWPTGSLMMCVKSLPIAGSQLSQEPNDESINTHR